MSKYIIEGGYKLNGKIYLSGNKNAILPCLAACLLTEEEVTLNNVPKIADVDVYLELLQFLGASVKRGEDWVKVQCSQVSTTSLPEELVSKLRASVLFAGPLLGRCGRVEFSHPGGDVIGRRSILPHLEGFKELGYSFSAHDQKRTYKGSRHQADGREKHLFLSEASVTGTENLVMASCLGEAKVIIKNCAEEPHVVDLCNLLIAMGAKITGVGTSTLIVEGVRKLSGTEFTIRADHIEFGTYAIAAALTRGEIEISKNNLSELEPIIYPLKLMGVKFKENEYSFIISGGDLQAIPKLKIHLWPGFPTDMMSAAIVLATQAKGVSLMHDWMYESRMFFVDKLIAMGAQITIADPHRVLIYGSTPLYGRNLETPDIRAGMAMVLAALIAEGESVIDRVELIERGYEDVVGKLTSLGAHIQRIG